MIAGRPTHFSLSLLWSANVDANAATSAFREENPVSGVARLSPVCRMVGEARRTGEPYPYRRSDATVSALFDNFLIRIAVGLPVTFLGAMIG
ncbi:hypothetical protein [Streptomyces sp. NPDC001665]